jgi:hypothetical protein
MFVFGFCLFGVCTNRDAVYAWENIIGIDIDYIIISTGSFPVIFLLWGIGFYLLVKEV